MLDVLECILNENQYIYLKDRDNYINYLIMVNMSFFKDILEWGGSITGAWFDCYGSDLELNRIQLTIPKDKIKYFIRQIVNWAKI